MVTWDDLEVPRPKMRSAGGGILTAEMWFLPVVAIVDGCYLPTSGVF